jgi:hypothetical protein
MTGLTFDTGALIFLERRRQRMKEIVERALAQDQPITVPADGGAVVRLSETVSCSASTSSRLPRRWQSALERRSLQSQAPRLWTRS